ncbi:MAG: hypothetical protein JNK58_11970 [Phycisphaerae bacterium]|nr:hypothetical protein [Phycisphaerae bacterium]
MRITAAWCCAVLLIAPVVALAQLEGAGGNAEAISNAQYWTDDSTAFPDIHYASATAAEIIAAGFDADLSAESALNPTNRGFSTASQHTDITATTITSSASVSSGWAYDGGAYITIGSAVSRVQILFHLPVGGHFTFHSGLFTRQVPGGDHSLATTLSIEQGDTRVFEAYEGSFAGASGDLAPGFYALRYELYTYAASFGPGGSSATLDFAVTIVPAPAAACSVGGLALMRRRRSTASE